jgi:bifunctional DNase/RNase
MNENTDLFELNECYINSILFDNENNYIVSIVSNEKEYGISLIGHDGSILTFVDSGCSNNAHISTIHQILLRFKKDCGFELVKVIIEAKYGDVIYCRLNWYHREKDRDVFNVVNIGDALILHSLTQAPMYITKFVLDQFETFDSDGYMETYED